MPLRAIEGKAAVLALTSILIGVTCSLQAVPEERIVIFEQEPWYRSRSEPEGTWDGTLRRREVVEDPNARTALRYSLVTNSAPIPVYAPQSMDRFEPFVGRAVFLRGKLIDLSSEGFGTELWPGSIARAR